MEFCNTEVVRYLSIGRSCMRIYSKDIKFKVSPSLRPLANRARFFDGCLCSYTHSVRVDSSREIFCRFGAMLGATKKFKTVLWVAWRRWVFWNFIQMYVCVCRGCPLWNAHGKGRPIGPGVGTDQVGPMSQPCGYRWSRVMHAGSYLRTSSAFCSQLYSGQLRVTCILILKVLAVSFTGRYVCKNSV